MGRMSELHAELHDRNIIMDKLMEIIGGNPIDEIAPVMVVAVARMLFIDAGSDPDKLGFLVAKFMSHMTEVLHDMAAEDGYGETRQ